LCLILECRGQVVLAVLFAIMVVLNAILGLLLWSHLRRWREYTEHTAISSKLLHKQKQQWKWTAFVSIHWNTANV